jgi:hypothetical protein
MPLRLVIPPLPDTLLCPGEVALSANAAGGSLTHSAIGVAWLSDSRRRAGGSRHHGSTAQRENAMG